MNDETKKLLEEYQKELENCYAIAQRLDSFNPEIKGAFTGFPSERIKRQLSYYGVNGFKENTE